ncbi:MAG: chemotaxis protein CheX [Pirellulales bacterium]|nr:chemotaxis protein CheX [Pirellulales bacterium]
MSPKYLEHFLTAAVSTFDIMLGCALTPREAIVKKEIQPEYEVSGVIGLSSKKAKGTVVLSLCHEAALSVSEALLGERPTDIDGDVVDAVGELTNIIAGAAKAKMEHLSLDISLPTTIVGKQHVMGFPHKAVSVCVPYESPWGDVAIEVALVETLDPNAPDEEEKKEFDFDRLFAKGATPTYESMMKQSAESAGAIR